MFAIETSCKVPRIFITLLVTSSVFCDDAIWTFSKPQSILKLTLNGLIKDWNSKHAETSEIVILNASNQSDLLEDVARDLEPINPVVIANPNVCGQIGGRNAAFVILFADTLHAVSS